MSAAPVALVTGAARRIGAALARALHADGMRVLVHHRDSEADASALVAELTSLRADSADLLQADLAAPGAAEALAEQAVARWGRLDLLVNNASSFFPTPLGSLTPTAWDDLMASNLRGPAFLSQALAPALRAARGAIVNLADVYAERPLADHAAYSAAKAGLVMLTRSLALDLAPEVRVNAIAPGAILWPVGDTGDGSPESLLASVPLGRMGETADVCGALRYLRDANWVTGQTIRVDGGRHLG